MTFKDWIDRMLGRPSDSLARAKITAKEAELVNRIAKLKGISPQEVREQAKRRAVLQIEAESYRRGHG